MKKGKEIGKSILFMFFFIALLATSCKDTENRYEKKRDRDPWFFRSVLDKQPRMLTLALNKDCYVAYNLEKGLLYKVWKGGILINGAPFTNEKNIQPSSYGHTYFSDSLQQSKWEVKTGESIVPIRVQHRGYSTDNNEMVLHYYIYLPEGDTVNIKERPEFYSTYEGKNGLERKFSVSGLPKGFSLSLYTNHTSYSLQNNEVQVIEMSLPSVPEQTKPEVGIQRDHQGKYWMQKSDCFTCHEIDHKTVGPGFIEIAQRYENNRENFERLTKKIIEGGSGEWGNSLMNPHPQFKENDIKPMLQFIFSLAPKETKPIKKSSPPLLPEKGNTIKPGFGASLEGVHPSFEVIDFRPESFQPKTGGMKFLRNGDLLISTWDSIGAVYRLKNVHTANPSEIIITRMASGLAEPLGIEVVDDEIFVVQKHELTQLIDHDGDGITDEYKAICNSWGVTADFHEFAFGPLYKDGYFYVTLSLAMRLMSNEKQKQDRGRTLKIARNGSYEWVNYGLRTPNGIGIGPENELFVTDNQGQWLPANKLIHVQPGQFHGMRWGLEDPDQAPEMTLPAIWLPEDEIGNSPSEPILVKEGPFKGQMLHGDVTHGGIKRDFLEKVNGQYQGAVFRFTQGLEAGVNRLCWGPEGDLYAGGVGMVGGWSWKEHQYGLQKLHYNGKETFEMLAIRSQTNGFEIEFTQPVEGGLSAKHFTIQQWWYEPTARYGGPKKDLENLKVTQIELVEEGKKVQLKIPGLKEGHVVYFLLSDEVRSQTGESLWSGESWYTLNYINKVQ